jgi:hypothetical protein
MFVDDCYLYFHLLVCLIIFLSKAFVTSKIVLNFLYIFGIILKYKLSNCTIACVFDGWRTRTQQQNDTHLFYFIFLKGWDQTVETNKNIHSFITEKKKI